jgi:23S rRNA (guanosine2251-2'-O)-methyltransferase
VEKKKLIAGRNPVYEYIRSGRAATGTVYLSENSHGKIIDQIIDEAKRKNVKVVFCAKEEISSMYSAGNDQGVLLSVSSAKIGDVNERELLEETAEKKGVLVLLDQLTDPHNIGAIIRTAEALGADGVLMPKAHSPEISATIVKTSAGATAHLPVCIVPNAARFLDMAHDAGFWVIGTDGSGTTKLSELSTIRPAVVVIGSEGEGMRRLTSEKCDFVARIPLRGQVTSLNASVAAGIVLYSTLNPVK